MLFLCFTTYSQVATHFRFHLLNKSISARAREEVRDGLLNKTNKKHIKNWRILTIFLRISFFYSTFAAAIGKSAMLGKQVRFLHRPAAVIRNRMFYILKVTG